MQHHHDILIVGAGPAGSSAAVAAAKNNAKVLLIDKKKIIGEPVQCAEYVPRLLISKIDVSSSCISQKVDGMKTYMSNSECFETRSPGYILHRDIFDKELVKKAVDFGADLCLNAECISKNNDKVLIKEKGKKRVITSKIVIGADGPCSTVGSWIKCENTNFLVGLQYKVPLVSPLNFTKVYFDKRVFGGYGWVFPKDKYANVGIGVKQGKPGLNLNNLLDSFTRFLEEKNIIKNTPVLKNGGLIPCGGFLNSVKDNIVLVGDAAGHTHPITGGGISQAVLCGRIAGKTASKAVNEDDFSILNEYKSEWQSIFADELNRAKIKRELFEASWNDLDNVIRKCWTTFREYYE